MKSKSFAIPALTLATLCWFGGFASASPGAAASNRSALYNHYDVPNSTTCDCMTSATVGPPSTIYSAYGWRAARSLHRGGVNILMADSSVHFVDETVDFSVWRALSTRAGGETNAVLP